MHLSLCVDEGEQIHKHMYAQAQTYAHPHVTCTHTQTYTYTNVHTHTHTLQGDTSLQLFATTICITHTYIYTSEHLHNVEFYFLRRHVQRGRLSAKECNIPAARCEGEQRTDCCSGKGVVNGGQRWARRNDGPIVILFDENPLPQRACIRNDLHCARARACLCAGASSVVDVAIAACQHMIQG